ncbi:MAG: sensor histidine kinase [Acidimicrobiia bacterium]
MTSGQAEPRGLAALRAELKAAGPIGRVALVSLAASAVVVVALGLWIPRQVERHFVNAEIDSRRRVAEELAESGLMPPDPGNPQAIAALDEFVKRQVLGVDTFRVKIWLPDGTIAYSDRAELIGERYPPTRERLAAFEGADQSDVPDLDLPEARFERGLPPLREYYIPVFGKSGDVVAVFEGYGLAEHIEGAVSDTRRYVWWSVAVSMGLFAVFIVGLLIVNGRIITRRQRLAEKLFGDLVQAQAEERKRIIGLLHDDIGQTLYRVHYGLEHLRSEVGSEAPQGGELAKLGSLVGEVERTLRATLRSLSHGTGEDLSLTAALDELAEVTEMETDLEVEVEVEDHFELSPVGRVALYRAAREAITNVRRHARATKAELRVYSTRTMVFIEVSDDGEGFSGEEGLGLTITRERLEVLGGGVRIRRSANGGTLFQAWVPKADLEVKT